MKLNFFCKMLMNRAYQLLLMLCLLFSACSTSGNKKFIHQPPPSPRKIVLSGLQADAAGREILMYALGLLDVNYRYGGNNPSSGLDCSGMIAYIYKNALGVNLPRTSAEMAKESTPISPDKMRVGDLLFFNTLNRAYSHVGLYIGQNKFIHAPHTNAKIRVDLLNSRYYVKHFEGARTFFTQ